VQLAGGFKETALLPASQVFRKIKTSRNIIWEGLENAKGGGNQEDSLYYTLENTIRTNGELVVADFVGLFIDKDKSKDIYLQDGDRIIIASRTKTVYVFGQVTKPGHVTFVKGEKYKYYIAKTGGLTDDAVSGDIRIIKGNSKQWLKPDETTVEEGDYIWVPKEPYRPFSYYVQIYSQLFGILGTLGTLTILVLQTKK
jgi:protein involved in polysaccharide export with SLBB domain